MSIPSELKTDLKAIIDEVENDKTIQGHICVNNTDLFDTSICNGIYGFPGDEKTTPDNLKVTAWRAIASLYNIGPKDIIILYRTATPPAERKRKTSVLGEQEFHGLFRVLAKDNNPMIFTHFNDVTFLPPRITKKAKEQKLPFRFLFYPIVKTPIAIPNDLRNQNYQKNNNLDVIKALSETDPKKPWLWGFRHPAVMNIGAARKSSIVSISNTQLLFFLNLMYNLGVVRPTATTPRSPKCHLQNLPEGVTILDDAFLSDTFRRHIRKGKKLVNLESILYAYFTGAIKNPKSVYHEKLIRELAEINPQLPFPDIAQNVMVGMIPSLHIQEEIDVLLCDSAEKNFLIFEMKNGPITSMDMEQAEKYIQLIKQRFTTANVYANVVGAKKPDLSSTEQVKLVAYTIEEFNGVAGITLKENLPDNNKAKTNTFNLDSFS